MQGRMLDLENNLRDETTEKKRLEREIKAKDRENQTALTEVSCAGIIVVHPAKEVRLYETSRPAGAQTVDNAGTAERFEVCFGQLDIDEQQAERCVYGSAIRKHGASKAKPTI
jgi:Mn-dependent DtxR family transcriptional regulator